MKTASQFIAALKRCSKMRDLESGKRLHQDALVSSLHTNRYVASTLIAMYSKCRSMAFAKQVFDGMIHKDVVAWTSLITGYAENGENRVALELFSAMDCKPNAFTYVAVIKAFGGLAGEDESKKNFCIEKGLAIHKQVKELGFESDMFVASTLVDMYSKCGSIDRAREVFDGMVSKNVVAWNCLILGYVQNRENLLAAELFTAMDCKPNAVTYVAALKAFGGLASENDSRKQFFLEKTVSIHKQVDASGFVSDMFVGSSLVETYSKCGNMDRAREVFDKMSLKDVVTWNSLITGYVQNGNNLVAIELFADMDCEPNSFTYVAALKACGGELDGLSPSAKEYFLEKGISLHEQIKGRGLEYSIFVASSLVDMYSKCGSMDRAREVFDRMSSKNVVTWTSLILGYVQNGESLVALEVFASMDCRPNTVTYVAALKACASLAALQAGRQVHAHLCMLGMEQDQLVTTTLVDLYGKCGSMNRAEEMFSNLDSPDMVSWNALIAGFGWSGDSSRVFSLVNSMLEAGFEKDTNTFICILTACSHTGVVDKGKLCFKSMVEDGVCPTLEHYTCMVDMLGRANKLEEAVDLIKNMPFEADTVIWTTLLGACRKWTNIEVGKVAFDALVSANPEEGAAYALLRDICRGSVSK